MTEVAIVGTGAVFPGDGDAPAFWRNIRAGTDAITDVSPDRWDPGIYCDPDQAGAGQVLGGGQHVDVGGLRRLDGVAYLGSAHEHVVDGEPAAGDAEGAAEAMLRMLDRVARGREGLRESAVRAAARVPSTHEQFERTYEAYAELLRRV